MDGFCQTISVSVCDFVGIYIYTVYTQEQNNAGGIKFNITNCLCVFVRGAPVRVKCTKHMWHVCHVRQQWWNVTEWAERVGTGRTENKVFVLMSTFLQTPKGRNTVRCSAFFSGDILQCHSVTSRALMSWEGLMTSNINCIMPEAWTDSGIIPLTHMVSHRIWFGVMLMEPAGVGCWVVGGVNWLIVCTHPPSIHPDSSSISSKAFRESGSRHLQMGSEI